MPKGQYTRKTPQEKFEEKISMEPNTGCWLWTAASFRKQYGEFYFEGKNQRAPRVAWQLFKGPIPKGLFPCHKCDTPACASPYHLFLGTQSDNMKDRANKGRNDVRGLKNPAHKLSETDVRNIRNDPRSYSTIGKEYGICVMTVCNIKRRKIWKHVE